MLPYESRAVQGTHYIHQPVSGVQGAAARALFALSPPRRLAASAGPPTGLGVSGAAAMDHWRDEASAACTGDLSRCSNPRHGNDQLVTLNCTGENCGASSKLRADPPPKRRHDRDVPPRASGRIADVREPWRAQSGGADVALRSRGRRGERLLRRPSGSRHANHRRRAAGLVRHPTLADRHPLRQTSIQATRERRSMCLAPREEPAPPPPEPAAESARGAAIHQPASTSGRRARARRLRGRSHPAPQFVDPP